MHLEEGPSTTDWLRGDLQTTMLLPIQHPSFGLRLDKLVSD